TPIPHRPSHGAAWQNALWAHRLHAQGPCGKTPPRPSASPRDTSDGPFSLPPLRTLPTAFHRHGRAFRPSAARTARASAAQRAPRCVATHGGACFGPEESHNAVTLHIGD